jgi:protocatechuate 3,4-dioxygenase beta subunit
LAGPDGRYGDAYRATVFADAEGAYRFESHFPPAYGGRPPHIHLRVSAAGYRILVTQHYPRPGDTEARFDVVLEPES